ncbi:MAG TPA: rRNA maturation RNase YbeY [Sphingobacteriaceae bacterium]|nr:rRNA maturation RNase YbeY [Sphingobacteriaceae bacterium]
MGGSTGQVRVEVMVAHWDDAPPVPQEIVQGMTAAVEAAVQAHAPPGRWLLDLTLTGDGSMAEINEKYRGRGETTDVLAFPQWSPEEWAAMGDQGPPGDAGGPEAEPLGDVVVNLAAAQRSAEAYGHSLARECAFLAVHGTLHLLGFDHGDEAAAARMEAATEAVLAPLGLRRGE